MITLDDLNKLDDDIREVGDDFVAKNQVAAAVGDKLNKLSIERDTLIQNASPEVFAKYTASDLGRSLKALQSFEYYEGDIPKNLEHEANDAHKLLSLIAGNDGNIGYNEEHLAELLTKLRRLEIKLEEEDNE